jgi:hypothetical protein
MTIQVDCYAGQRGEQEPRAFVLGDQRLDVVDVRDRWLAPEHRYFRVKASDGHTYVLRHDERSGEWTLSAFRKGADA